MERAGSFYVEDSPPSSTARSGLASWYTPGLSDGFGDRLLMFDNGTASSLELLRFKREFSSVPAFEAALRERLRQLAAFSHPSIGRVRAIEWLGEGQGLALVSNQTPGPRLSQIVQNARGPTYARELIRQLTPVLAALHQQDDSIAHGALTADRIVVTPEGRLVIVDHVMGSALESLQLSPSRLRSEFGLAAVVRGDNVPLDRRADILQLGLLALSLLVGRRVDPADYPGNIPALLDEFSQKDGHGSLASLRLRWWLEHALAIDGLAFDSALDAQDALHELPEDMDMQPAPSPTKQRTLHALPDPGPIEPNASVRTTHESMAPPDFPRQDGPAPVRTPTAFDTVPEPVAIRRASSTRWIVAALGGLALVEAVVIGGLIYQRRQVAAAPVAAGPLVLVESDIAGAEVIVDGKRAGSTPVMLPLNAGMRSIHLVPTEAAAAAAAAAPANAALPAGQGQLEVTSDPAGARVSIDGTRRGVTPLTLPIPSGQHSVVVSDGTTTASRTVTVSAGTTSTVMAAMAPAGTVAGWLTITAPFDLQVFEGGNLLGTTSAARIMLAAGHHDLDLRNTALGFESKASVDIQPGKTVTAPVTVPNGSLSVNALPWANVLVDGKEVGTTPLANLEVTLGNHELVFRHPQLGERRQTVTVTAKGPLRIVTDLRK